MANIAEETISNNVGEGILLPQLENCFRVEWLLSDKDVKNTISCQVLNFHVDYKERTIEFDIEQPVMGGALHECLWGIFSWTVPGHQSIRLYSAVGETAHYILNFIAEPKSHKFVLDYSKSGAAKHHLVFKILNVFAVDPETVMQAKTSTAKNDA